MATTTSTPKITVLGSLNIDLVAYVSHHPLPGETMTANSVAVSPGGKGANQAVACAKLSRSHTSSSSEGETAHITMLGTVGADSYGTLLKENLAKHGVDVSGVRVLDAPGSKTGMAMIVVDEPTGQNRIILSPEANHFLQPEHVADVAHLSAAGQEKPDLLIMQLEIPVPTVLQALKTAKQNGVQVLLNPAPAVPLPDEAFAGLAHLVVNETEASILSGLEESVLDTEEGLEKVGKVFLQRAVKTVIVTLGGRGVFFMTDNGEKKGLVQAEKAKVVDTTAAGDTFVGMYALEVVTAAKKGERFDIERAVRKANKAAAKTVERAGAQDSIPWRDELL
ncbi:Ribokinase-like protein [Pseudoneurospora amorphoporcata]|uniref:Ribokinase n=1 Tax=Pseudoneurospora amorphoporcata TaxID=241081 RepID=A0AAN6P4F2_9PEZI|nr:Ribokinase-like protein [Pseudoneurospora amorphoporcata]